MGFGFGGAEKVGGGISQAMLIIIIRTMSAQGSLGKQESRCILKEQDYQNLLLIYLFISSY